MQSAHPDDKSRLERGGGKGASGHLEAMVAEGVHIRTISQMHSLALGSEGVVFLGDISVSRTGNLSASRPLAPRLCLGLVGGSSP